MFRCLKYDCPTPDTPPGFLFPGCTVLPVLQSSMHDFCFHFFFVCVCVCVGFLLMGKYFFHLCSVPVVGWAGLDFIALSPPNGARGARALTPWDPLCQAVVIGSRDPSQVRPPHPRPTPPSQETRCLVSGGHLVITGIVHLRMTSVQKKPELR